MFETSVVREQTQAAEQRFGLLSASVAVHSIVILAAIVLSIASITFPKNSPNQMSSFQQVLPVTIPPPLGTPHREAAALARPAAAPHQATAPAAITTPTIVPDTIPTVGPSGPVATGPVGEPSAGPVGDPNGIPGGVGDNPATPAVGDVPDSGPMMPVGDVKPAVVLHRVQPLYPRQAQILHLNGMVVVECVIGRDGSIRDPHVVRSTNAIFDQSALDAVRQWTFAPGSYHGRTVDTYFDLTVTFTIR